MSVRSTGFLSSGPQLSSLIENLSRLLQAAGLPPGAGEPSRWEQESRAATAETINALLVPGLPSQALESLDRRERGYHRITLEAGSVTPFREASWRRSGRTMLYCGKPEKRNDSLLPNAEYLELCLLGAGQWGQDFQDHFLKSTFVSGQTNGEFLAGRP